MEWGRPSPESLGLVEWKWAASRVEAVNSGFLSISDFDHRVPAELGKDLNLVTDSVCVEYLRCPCLVIYPGVLVSLRDES